MRTITGNTINDTNFVNVEPAERILADEPSYLFNIHCTNYPIQTAINGWNESDAIERLQNSKFGHLVENLDDIAAIEKIENIVK